MQGSHDLILKPKLLKGSRGTFVFLALGAGCVAASALAPHAATRSDGRLAGLGAFLFLIGLLGLFNIVVRYPRIKLTDERIEFLQIYKMNFGSWSSLSVPQHVGDFIHLYVIGSDVDPSTKKQKRLVILANIWKMSAEELIALIEDRQRKYVERQTISAGP
jgi:hypothetical protein